MVPSSLADASIFPSGENTTHLTPASWAITVRSSPPVPGTQILMVVSSLPEASKSPKGEKAIDNTEPVCPLRVTQGLTAFPRCQVVNTTTATTTTTTTATAKKRNEL